jgi:hypothetical protein
VKDWYPAWKEFMRPDIQARIVDRYASRYMRLSIFLREFKRYAAESDRAAAQEGYKPHIRVPMGRAVQ